MSPRKQIDRFPCLLVISASAGSGKTESLARHYLSLVLPQGSPSVDISQILAITFTKAAAREMKERILDLLKRLALKGDDRLSQELGESLGMDQKSLSMQASGLIAAILDRYSDFQVTTIDAFNHRLASAAAVELDLAPQSQVALDYQDLIPLALDSLLRAAAQDPDLEQALHDYMEALNEQSHSSFVWRPAQKLEEIFSGFLQEEAKLAGGLVFEDTRTEQDEAWRKMRQAVAAIDRAAAEGGLDLKNFEKIKEAVARRDLKYICSRKLDEKNSPCRSKDRDTPWAQIIVREWGRLEALRGRAAQAFARGFFHPYGCVYRKFLGFLDSAKTSLSVIHIDDIARRLAGLLRQDNIPEVYLRMGSRLRHFLLDEFQDTDPQQWRAMRPLVEEALAGQGSLFLVGDLKQAIYQFRQADYRIMRRLMQEIKGEAGPNLRELPASVVGRSKVEELGHNRRSGGIIVEYVAEVFHRRLPDLIQEGAFGPDVTGLTQYRQEPDPALSEKGYVSTRHCPQGVEKERWRKEQILSIIAEARQRGYSLGQIAILAPENKDLHAALQWLAEAGIPALSSGTLDIRQRKPAGEMVCLLKFLESPRDDLSFAQFLGGRIFRTALGEPEAFGPRHWEALALRAAREGRRLYQIFREEAGHIWEKYFEELYRRVGFYPLYDLLALALHKFEVFERLSREAAAFIKMLEAANRLAQEGQNSLQDFLARWESPGGDLFSLELPEYIESVRAYTVHAAKGLGFPLVINLIYDKSQVKEQMGWDRGEDRQLMYVPKYLAQCSPSLNDIYQQAWEEASVQLLNRLYVSCTRARSELYNLVEGEPGEPIVRLFPEQERGDRETGSGRQEIAVPSLPQSYGGPSFPQGLEPWQRRRARETERGIRYHRVLEHLDLRAGRLEGALAQALAQVERRYGPLPERQEMAQRLTQFLSLPQVQEAFVPRAEGEVYTETELADAQGNLYRIDRLIVNQDEVLAWEFKSGERRDYRMQIAVYRELLAQCYPGRRIRVLLGYLDIPAAEEAV